jgi:CTP synthase
MLAKAGLDSFVVEKFGLDCELPDLSDWDDVIDRKLNPEKEVTIAMVGKYMDLLDAYKSLIEAIDHAGIRSRTKVNIQYIDSEDIEKQGTGLLENVSGILVPGGFGHRGVEGKIMAAQFARENGVPYLGICLGMQVAVIEFARHVCGLEGAHSTEFDKQSRHPVIGLITEWIEADGKVVERDESTDLGGTMRLGGQECLLAEDSISREVYGRDRIVERHRHRYEVNNHYVQDLEKAGLRIAGRSSDGALVEIVENPDHPWFVACQAHPEFTSTPRKGHGLFSGFISAVIDHSQG